MAAENGVIKSKRAAAEHLEITAAQLTNLIKSGEIAAPKVGNRYTFKVDELNTWKNRRAERLIQLTRDDYLEALRFAIRAFSEGMTRSDFARTVRRDAGKFLTNQVQGKLAEIALKRFLERREKGLVLHLDFSFEGVIPGQDIVQVQRGKVANPPRVRVGIKATKSFNMLLAIPEGEADREDRQSDIYILVRVALPDDHIIRLLGSHPDLEDIADELNDIQEIEAEITGLIGREDLDGPDSAPLGVAMATPNYFKRSGELRNGEEDWDELVKSL